VTTNRPLAAPGLALSAFLALLLASAVLGQEPVMNGRVVGVTDADSLKNFVAVQRTRMGGSPPLERLSLQPRQARRFFFGDDL
jgi:hypothetical protein